MNSNTTVIRCPSCFKGRIIDASEKTDKRKITTYKPDEADKAEWFVKCPNCKNQIGLAFKY